VIPHQGKIADDLTEEGQQRVGPRWRDGVPCAEVGVAYAFLRILAAVQAAIATEGK